jgi:hypothetical protein
MKPVKNKYALRQKSTGELVGFTISSNEGGDFCNGEQYILEVGEEKLWLVDDPQQAEWVRLNSTDWYNAGYDTPTHYFDEPDDFEVVAIDIPINTKPVEVSIPTPYDFFKAKYAKKEPKHWEYLQERLKTEDLRYEWYDLKQQKRKKS